MERRISANEYNYHTRESEKQMSDTLFPDFTTEDAPENSETGAAEAVSETRAFEEQEERILPVIDSFSGPWQFMSNFWMAPVRVCFPGYGCWTFPSSEHAFQAAKCPSRSAEFLTGTPGEAKRLGRKVDMRRDWEEVKDDVMYDVVREKFRQNPDLADLLVSSAPAYLIEGNTWGDRYWGQVNGNGKNMLGITLMRVRDEIIAGEIVVAK